MDDKPRVMTDGGSATTRPRTRTVVYHDGRYAVSPDRIVTELDDSDGVAVTGVVRVDEGAPVADEPSTDTALPVVFSDTRPADLPAERLPGVPAVWVTTEGPVARAALEGDAVDAVLWRPGDGWATLVAKLQAIVDRPDTRPKQPVEPRRPDGQAADRDLASTVDAEETALYEYLVRTVGDAVYILDAEGRFTFVNDALCKLTGYEREELLGESVHIIKDDETVAEAEEALRDLLRESGTADAFDLAKLDVELITKDGEHIPCTDRMTLRPSDEDGNLTGTVGTLRDVSRQQRRENILSGLLETSQDMVQASTTAEVTDRVVDAAVDVLDIDLVVVREYDPEAGVVVPVGRSEAVKREMPDRPLYEPGEGPVGTAFAEDRTVVVEDLDGYDDRNRGDVDAVAVLPIGDRRTLSASPREGQFDDDELRFLELLAATAGSVFQRVERGEELRRYEAVVETAEELLFTTDAEGRFALVTGPLAEYLGHDRESLAGTPAAEVFPDDAVVADVVDDPTATAYETVLRARDGELIPSRVSIAPIGDGADAGVVGTVRDIRELRSAKREASRQRQRFRELFDTLDDPVADVEYDGDAVLRGANPSFVRLCSCGEDTVTDEPLAAVREQLPEGIADALAAVEEPGTSVERSVETRTGAGRRYYLLKTVPYEGDDAERAFLILTDVTKLERRGTHLSVLQRLLRHNLRTETTVIQGYAQGLADSDDPAVERAGREISQASQSLVDTSDTAHTIRQVLDADSTDRDAVSAAALGDRIEETLAAGFPDEDVTVRTDADADATVRASEFLDTGVAELVDNAVTHAGTDPSVTVTVSDADGDLSLVVRDDGPGVPDAEWDVVFGNREITQLQHTSGLGLWLVKWIADRHGGRLERVDPDEDGGAVAIRLPTA